MARGRKPGYQNMMREPKYDLELYTAIVNAINNGDNSVLVYEDLYRTIQKDKYALLRWKDTFRKKMEECAKMENYDDAERMRTVLRSTLLFTAKEKFEDYLEAIEFDNKPEDKFYAPRKHYLKPIVEAYQELADKKIRFLSISMPKRSGKSTLGINFVCWLSGRYADRSSLIEGSGDALVTSFYNGVLEYMESEGKYLYRDIFPQAKVVQTNADTHIINLRSKKRFPTVMCRSIDSTQVGLSEASNVLYLDDCIEGREEAKNRKRLDDKWEKISGDVIGRALEGTPIVICGTRYSLYDPIGRLQEHAMKVGWKWKAIEIPALDDKDESNYEFYNPKTNEWTFTSEYFREQRELISREQFESEFQQQPFEAKGIMFPVKELNRYYELPIDKEPDAIVSVCDPAEKGDDSTSMPIAYVYGTEVYIHDVVFDNATPNVTKPEVAKKLVEHKVSECTFESNASGEYYARDVDELVKALGGKVSIRTRRTVTNKHTRIEFASDNIIKHFWFLDSSKYDRGGQYDRFMREVISYTRSGKNLHDDAPDSLAMLENVLRSVSSAKVEIFNRPF